MTRKNQVFQDDQADIHTTVKIIGYKYLFISISLAKQTIDSHLP